MNNLIKLHMEIDEFCELMSPTRKEDEMRYNVVDKVREVVAGKWPDAKVEIYGSFSTGFHLPTSDIDLVIIGDWIKPPLHELEEELLAADICSRDKIRVIDKASVPIVKFTHNKSNIKVDISFNIESGLKSIDLIQSFSFTYPPLKKLVIILKQYLLEKKLNEVFYGGISSYSLILMVISFLQLHSKLDTKLYNYNLGFLLIEFFELYGIQFNYLKTGISIKDEGTYISKDKINTDYPPSILCIEDPLTPGNDIGRGCYGVMNVRQAFEHAYISLNQISNPLIIIYNNNCINKGKKSILGKIINAFENGELEHRRSLHEQEYNLIYTQQNILHLQQQQHQHHHNQQHVILHSNNNNNMTLINNSNSNNKLITTSPILNQYNQQSIQIQYQQQQQQQHVNNNVSNITTSSESSPSDSDNEYNNDNIIINISNQTQQQHNQHSPIQQQQQNQPQISIINQSQSINNNQPIYNYNNQQSIQQQQSQPQPQKQQLNHNNLLLKTTIPLLTSKENINNNKNNNNNSTSNNLIKQQNKLYHSKENLTPIQLPSTPIQSTSNSPSSSSSSSSSLGIQKENISTSQQHQQQQSMNHLNKQHIHTNTYNNYNKNNNNTSLFYTSQYNNNNRYNIDNQKNNKKYNNNSNSNSNVDNSISYIDDIGFHYEHSNNNNTRILQSSTQQQQQHTSLPYINNNNYHNTNTLTFENTNNSNNTNSNNTNNRILLLNHKKSHSFHS